MITIPATVIPVSIAAFAAYAFSWMKFWGRDFFFLALVGLLAVPLQATFIPILSLFVKFGLTPENVGFLGLWLAHTGYGLPFAIYLLANFFRSLPTDLFESAEIDGAGTLTVFFRIVLPLSVPAIASLVIFQFLWIWNDYLVALIYVGGTAGLRAANRDDCEPRQLERPGLGALDLRSVLLHDRALDRLLQPPTLLRPRHSRRFG